MDDKSDTKKDTNEESTNEDERCKRCVIKDNGLRCYLCKESS